LHRRYGFNTTSYSVHCSDFGKKHGRLPLSSTSNYHRILTAGVPLDGPPEGLQFHACMFTTALESSLVLMLSQCLAARICHIVQVMISNNACTVRQILAEDFEKLATVLLLTQIRCSRSFTERLPPHARRVLSTSAKRNCSGIGVCTNT